jgi:hypothetical protein
MAGQSGHAQEALEDGREIQDNICASHMFDGSNNDQLTYPISQGHNPWSVSTSITGVAPMNFCRIPDKENVCTVSEREGHLPGVQIAAEDSTCRCNLNVLNGRHITPGA